MPTATFVTSLGEFKVRLMPDHAPKTVANFTELATGAREWTHPRTGRRSSDRLAGPAPGGRRARAGRDLRGVAPRRVVRPGSPNPPRTTGRLALPAFRAAPTVEERCPTTTSSTVRASTGTGPAHRRRSQGP